MQDGCAEALDELEMEPQDDEYDHYCPEFYVTQAVELVGNALAVSMRPSAVKVETSVNTVRSLLAMLDFKFEGERPVVVRCGETFPPPGLLLQKEIDAEREVLSLLTQEGEGSAGNCPVATRVRTSANAFSMWLLPAVKEFAEISNWEL
ncbi:hypothetical protein [Actinosynnema pretiosum]|uniref:hypothetical protein n=1 Tax=Actinosynnema pretiosum TaxID=42197 RepID=UPI0012FE38F5|nr:hypothetical protein [Actinosynnema pretiosum]